MRVEQLFSFLFALTIFEVEDSHAYGGCPEVEG